MRRFLTTTPLVLALLAGSVLACPACNTPGPRPEMALIHERLDEIGPQPESPLQLKYRVVGPVTVDTPAQILLSFWPASPVLEAGYRVEASEGLASASMQGWTAIAPKGGVETVRVTPRRGGYHYVEVITRVLPVDGEAIERRSLVVVAVETPQITAPGKSTPGGLGFAGERMRKALGK